MTGKARFHEDYEGYNETDLRDGVMSWRSMTKLCGPVERHLEQLWDEVKCLKERVNLLEKELKKKDATK